MPTFVSIGLLSIHASRKPAQQALLFMIRGLVHAALQDLVIFSISENEQKSEFS